MTNLAFDETKVVRDPGGRFSEKNGTAPEVSLTDALHAREEQKPVMGIGEKRPMRPGKTALRATKLPGGRVRVTSTADDAGFENVFERANFLSTQDKIRGVAERVEGAVLFDDGTPSYDYKCRLSVKDGPYFRQAEIDYGTGLGVTETPSVGDAMGALAETAQVAEQFSMDDVDEFAREYGYSPEPGPHPYAEAEAALAFAHESKTVLTVLVGEERYGDYVWGAEKSKHGYTGGTTWSA